MQTLFMRQICVGLSIVLLGASVAWGKGPKITDPAKAGVDFQLQGEYAGVIEGSEKYGIQVIALGLGKFKAVGFPGGLPGAGWTGKDKVSSTGSLKGNQVVFKSDHGVGTLKKGSITVSDTEGKSVGKLQRVVRKSKTLGQKPPKGAVVLFNGKSVDGWINGKMTKDGLLEQGTTSKARFGSMKIHIEFRLPFQPQDRGQGRGNSGIYLQGRYEVQMLDSFGLKGKNNECGGIYSVKDPSTNMCFPPLSWQTYDIEYTSAKYDKDGKLTKDPRMTVYHNGVIVQKDVKLPGNRSTTGAPVRPGPEAGPIYLQNHSCPIRYRNIWVVKLK